MCFGRPLLRNVPRRIFKARIQREEDLRLGEQTKNIPSPVDFFRLMPVEQDDRDKTSMPKSESTWATAIVSSPGDARHRRQSGCEWR